MGLFDLRGSNQSSEEVAIQALLKYDARIVELQNQAAAADRTVEAAEVRLTELTVDGDGAADSAGDELNVLLSRASVSRRALAIAIGQRDSRMAAIGIARAERLESEAVDIRRKAQKLRSRMEPHWKAILEAEFPYENFDHNYVKLKTTDDLIELFPYVPESGRLVESALKLEREASEMRRGAVHTGRAIMETYHMAAEVAKLPPTAEQSARSKAAIHPNYTIREAR